MKVFIKLLPFFSLSFLIFSSPLTLAQSLAAEPEQYAAIEDDAPPALTAPELTEGLARYLPSNSEAWFARYFMIKNAKHTIVTQYFIIDNDVMGKAFLGLLLQKLDEGVTVNLMVDRRGTKDLTNPFPFGHLKYLEALASHGATVKVFNPIGHTLTLHHLFDHLKYEALISDHQKLLIVDDRYFITGGRNISKDYLIDQTQHPGAYMDTDGVYDSPELAKAATDAFFYENYKGHGSVTTAATFNDESLTISDIIQDAQDAQDATTAIQEDIIRPIMEPKDASDELHAALAAIEDRMAHGSLNKTTMAKFPELLKYPCLYMTSSRFKNYQLFDKTSIKTPVMFLANSSALHTNDAQRPKKTEITDSLLDAIDSAKESIIIQNPYIVLTPRMHQALINASERGVKVTFLTNSPLSTDSLLTQAYFYHNRNDLLEEIRTLQIFAIREQKKLHAKVFVIDSDVTYIGSYNMDFISEQTNAEGSVKIVSQDFNKMAREQINDWIAKKTVKYSTTQGAEQIETIDQALGQDTRAKIREDEFLASLAQLVQERL